MCTLNNSTAAAPYLVDVGVADCGHLPEVRPALRRWAALRARRAAVLVKCLQHCTAHSMCGRFMQSLYCSASKCRPAGRTASGARRGPRQTPPALNCTHHVHVLQSSVAPPALRCPHSMCSHCIDMVAQRLNANVMGLTCLCRICKPIELALECRTRTILTCIQYRLGKILLSCQGKPLDSLDDELVGLDALQRLGVFRGLIRQQRFVLIRQPAVVVLPSRDLPPQLGFVRAKRAQDPVMSKAFSRRGYTGCFNDLLFVSLSRNTTSAGSATAMHAPQPLASATQ